jgi:SAM-dependent methyltransferase
VDERWNHNIHYHALILAAVPPGCQRALDVGCGEGLLTQELKPIVAQAIGIDVDPPSIAAARARDPDGELEFLLGDFVSHPFEPRSFDLIASVAVLHHLDATTALTRMTMLLRPGGTLVVVGLARSRMPHDLLWEIGAVAVHRWHLLTKTYWEHSAPTVWPPPHTFSEIRHLAQQLLPGVRFRRHLLWRYSLVWTKPVATSTP